MARADSDNDSLDSDEIDLVDSAEDAYSESEEVEETKRVATPPKSDRKRKSNVLKAKNKAAPKKRVKKDAPVFGVASDSEPESDDSAESGIGDIVAPKPRRPPPKDSVPPGQISKSTLDFLGQLTKQSCQDRDWFAEHEAVYKHALEQWKAFITHLTPEMQKADRTLPTLPARDLVYRIYRDVRFSTNKNPYKTNMSASFSRTGRKGPFAGYYIQIAANGKSLIAAGRWSPDKNELATIRHNIMTDSRPLRRIISAPEFVELFGPAEPIPPPGKTKAPRKKKGEEDTKAKTVKVEAVENRRQNVFGHDDELKVAPKGVPKDHKDIDLLKLRTIAVTKTFTDEQVLSPDFAVKVANVARVMEPLVAHLNELLVPTPRSDSESDD